MSAMCKFDRIAGTGAQQTGHGWCSVHADGFPGARAKADGMEITRNASRPSGKGPAEYFTGAVRIDPLIAAPDPARVADDAFDRVMNVNLRGV